MSRIFILLVLGYIVFTVVRFFLKTFLKNNNTSYFHKEEKRTEYDKSKVVDAKFEEIK